MGATPSTGSVCPFPSYAPEGSNASAVEQCTLSYAELAGPGYIVQSVLLLGSAVVLGVVMARRLLRAIRLQPITSISGIFAPAKALFTVGFILAVYVFFGALNLFGFQTKNAIPFQMYSVVNELIASHLLSAAMVVCDTWAKIGGALTQRSGFSVRAKVILALLTTLNFVGFEVASLCVPTYKPLLDSLKSIGAIIFLTLFSSVASMAVYAIVTVLYSNTGQPGSEQSFALARSLLRKFLAYVFVCLLAIAFEAVGLAANLAKGWPEEWIILPGLSLSSTAFNVVYLLAMWWCLWSIQLPRKPADSKTIETDSNRRALGHWRSWLPRVTETKGSQNSSHVLPE